jgi:hypothetical protein
MNDPFFLKKSFELKISLTEVEGCEDVLFRVERVLVLSAQHQLSVVDDEEGEDQRAQCSVPYHCVPEKNERQVSAGSNLVEL